MAPALILEQIMMNSMKKLGVIVAVFALCAIGAANVSAAEFTTTVEGNLNVESNELQVFTFSSGTVTCKKVVVTGKTTLALTKQHITAHYSECTGASGSPVHVSPATYLLTASGPLHVENMITFTLTSFFGTCHTAIGKQTRSVVSYQSGAGKITVNPNVSSIVYTTTGFPCGSGGNNGTYTGAFILGVEGGSLAYHA
jgi:hypothetical protein